MKLLLVLLSLMGASALIAGPLAAQASSRTAVVSMACNGGKGGQGGKSPPKDKERRGKLRRLLYVADSAENVQSILFSSQTERMILKMGWKHRKHAKHHITKRAAEFDVTVPSNFAGFDAAKQSTKKHLLVPSITTTSPVNAAAVKALATAGRPS